MVETLLITLDQKCCKTYVKQNTILVTTVKNRVFKLIINLYSCFILNRACLVALWLFGFCYYLDSSGRYRKFLFRFYYWLYKSYGYSIRICDFIEIKISYILPIYITSVSLFFLCSFHV